MEIIKRTDGLTAKSLYQLTKGNDVRKMADAKGEVVEITAFVLYSDTNVSTGEITQILAIETKDGARYATNSKTLIRNFSDILSMYEDAGEPIPTTFKIGSGRSRSGREYLTCDLA